MPYIRQIVGWAQGLVDGLNGLDEVKVNAQARQNQRSGGR